MTNNQVVEAFYNKKRAKTKNLTSIGNKLISYNTTIAERIVINGITLIVKNITRYSNSTSKHQALVDKYNCITKNTVPRNTANLLNYISNK